MRKRPLLWFACVFLSGLAFERYKLYSLIFALIVCIGVEIYYGAKYKVFWKGAVRSFVLLSAFLLGMAHMRIKENFREAYMSNVCNGDTVIVWGEILKIENTDYGVRMILSDCYISLNEENIPCNDVLVYASSNHFHVGEIHRITGKLNLFERARNQGNFDACTFYQSQKIDFSIWCETYTCLDEGSIETEEYLSFRTIEYRLKNTLLLLRDNLKSVFTNCMELKSAGFFTGMLLGDKTNLENKIKELFTLGGISHILAISGLHVSMIGRNFYQILRRMGIPFLGAGAMAGILLLAYGYLVGNSMSAVRAIGMMCIFFFAQYLGRSYDMLNALGAMVIVLLWDNPFLLEYSGFWFSVMALIGVGFVGNTFSGVGFAEKLFPGAALVEKIFSGVAMSLGITLTTLPVVAYCYYEIPLYSPLVNAIVLPLLTPIFILALCGSIIGVFAPALARVLLMPCDWGLDFYIWLCEQVEKLPYASIICGQPKWWVVVLYYVILACGVGMLQKWRKRIVMFCVSFLCLWLIIYPKEKKSEISFLDVGQGDAIYISTGDETVYFIDGGSTSEDDVGEYRILPFLKSKGIDSVDYWFVSHADLDHISGLLEVMECGYDIEHLVVSKYAPKDENLGRLLDMASVCGIDVIWMEAGDRIQSEHTKMECIYPRSGSSRERNDASLVLEMELADKRKAFFAGDISSEVEQLLLRRGMIDDVWIYKASHHGSKYSNSTELLAILQPEITVISCGENNFYGHPHEETIERIKEVRSEILYTMENGQVSFLLLQ